MPGISCKITLFPKSRDGSAKNYTTMQLLDDRELSKLRSRFFFKAKGLSKQHTAGLKIHNINCPKKTELDTSL